MGGGRYTCRRSSGFDPGDLGRFRLVIARATTVQVHVIPACVTRSPVLSGYVVVSSSVSHKQLNTYPANTRHSPMLFRCWLSVEDDGPVLKQHWVNASCLLGESKLKPGLNAILIYQET